MARCEPILAAPFHEILKSFELIEMLSIAGGWGGGEERL